MKKQIRKLLLLIAGLLVSLNSFAQILDEQSGLYFNILSEDDKTVEITYKDISSEESNANYVSGVLDIPTTITYNNNSYTITQIGYKAFYGCTALNSVSLPNTLLTIEPESFTGCSNLKTFTIPSSVTSIGMGAFSRCSNLETITIPSNVIELDGTVFSGCTNLTTVNIEAAEIKEIPYRTFDGCIKLKSINIPNSVTKIGPNVFSGCTSLENIEFEDGETDLSLSMGYDYNSSSDVGPFNDSPIKTLYLGRNIKCTDDFGHEVYSYSPPFQNKTTLEALTIGENITGLTSYAFSGCSSLETINIPNNVEEIGRNAFSGCTSLEELIFEDEETDLSLRMEYDPNNSSYIGPFNDSPIKTLYLGRNIKCTDDSGSEVYSSAFQNKTTLETLTIGEAVEEIMNYAFNGCTALNSVSLPNTLLTIGHECFTGCKSLKTFTIPNSVTSIGIAAFCGCSNLETITIPSSVVELSGGVFSGCENLTTVNIESAEIEQIPYNTFADCIKLKSISIPNSVTTIESSAFSGCTSLEELIFENGEEYITFVVISDYNYSDYSYSYSRPFDDSPIKNLYLGRYISVSDEHGNPLSIDPFESAEFELTLGNSFTSIKDNAFANWDCIKSLTIADGEGDLYIPASAFAGTSFTSVTTGRNITGDAFAGKNIDLKFSEKMTDIKADYFSGLSYLKSLTIPAHVNSIESGAFANCANLKTLNLAAASTDLSIAETAFDGSTLETVVAERYFTGNPFTNNPITLNIPNTFTAIRDNAFSNMSGIKGLYIADGETELSIPATAFANTPIESLRLGRILSAHPFDASTSLKSLSIGNCYAEMADGDFSDCPELTDLIVEDGTEVLTIAEKAFENAPISKVYAGRPIVEDPLKGKEIELTIGKNFTDLASGDFCNISALKSLIIPNTVASVADGAFGNPPNLSKLTIADGDTEISLGSSAFYPSPITELSVGRNISGYGYYSPFSEMKKLTNLTITAGATSLNEELFAYNSLLENLTIANGSTPLTIAASTFTESPIASLTLDRSLSSTYFSGNKLLKELTVGGNLTSLSDYSFSDCTALESVKFLPGENTLYASSSVFSNSPIKKVILGRNMTGYTFSGKSALTDLTISNDVTLIGYGVFSSCSGLNSVIIPNSVTSIQSGAFSNCTSLSNLTLSNTLETIASNAFSNCPGLLSVSLPSNVKTIGEGAFSNCSGLAKLILPGSLTTVSDNAFAYCYDLKELYIESGEGDLTISSTAFTNSPIENLTIWRDLFDTPFSGMTSLKNLWLGWDVTKINDYAFSGCTGLNFVDITKNITQIGEYAFENCTAINRIHCYPTIPPSTDITAFSNETYANAELWLMTGCTPAYQADTTWRNFINMVDNITSGVESLDSSDVKISNVGNEIKVAGANDGSLIEVYNASGQLVYSGCETTINIPTRGIYFVRIEGTTQKVAL